MRPLSYFYTFNQLPKDLNVLAYTINFNSKLRSYLLLENFYSIDEYNILKVTK